MLRSSILRNVRGGAMRGGVMRIQKSKLDDSVNFIIPKQKSFLECRYIRRNSQKISVYVSSHNGCKMGCKFCFLTQQGQTEFKHSTIEDYTTQVNTVMDHYRTTISDGGVAQRVNINFMARGEPLANKHLIRNYNVLYNSFALVLRPYDLPFRCNISTIMPYSVKDYSLYSIFGDHPAYLYYSMYSTNNAFRNEWLPNSLPWETALEKIANYQQDCHNINNRIYPLTIHFTLIKGQNDNLDDIVMMAKEIKTYDLFGKINLVRYNNPPGLDYEESPHMDDALEILKGSLLEYNDVHSGSRVVPRIGQDVSGSCGMFISE